MPLNFVAKAAISVGLAAANMALTMTRKIDGPRLDNLKFTGGDYGAPLYMVWGTRRLEVPIFWAEDLKEVQRRRKTKGGKYNEFTYYGTWAVAVAGHQVAGIRRIWFDTHLVYDLTGGGPVTPFDFGGNSGTLSDFVTIYLGTEDQEPDPRMQATVEALWGEGSCPAYRGTAYVVFKDIPLEKLGNRIPQVSVEVASGEVFPSDELDTGSGGFVTFSYDKAMILKGRSTGWSLIDTPAREIMAGPIDSDSVMQDDASGYALLENATTVTANGFANALFQIDLMTGAATQLSIPGGTIEGTSMSVMGADGEHWMVVSYGDRAFFDGDAIDLNAILGHGTDGYMILADMDGWVWLVCRNDDDDTEVVFHQLTGPSVRTVRATGLPSSSTAYAFHYRDADHDQFVLGFGGQLWTIDFNTGDVLNNYTPDFPTGIQLDTFLAISPGSPSFYIGFEQISSRDLTQIRLLDRTDWSGDFDDQARTVYDPINHALIEYSGSTTLIWRFLDRVGADGVPLSQIEDDVADWVGIVDADFSAHTQEVQGWSATQGQASNIIEPLHSVYDCTIRPHDFTLQGINYTGVAAGTLYTERFVAGEPRYMVKVRQAAELPRAVVVNFADFDAEQQPNNVRSDRPLDAMGGRGEQTLDLTTWVSDADEARSYGDRYFRRLWNERREVTLSLTAQQLGLEPGDLRTLDLDGDADTYRLISLKVRADDVLETEWRYDHPSLAVTDSAQGANFDGRTDAVIPVPLLSRGFVLDTPYISDEDDQSPPIVYALIAPWSAGTWPGARMLQQVDGEYSEEIANVTTSQKATWGYVTEELPYANPNLWDRGNEITVTLHTGTLTGCTESEIDANPLRNLCAIGANERWEFINFTNAELTDTNTYTLSGFKRGRRGTEWAAELHAANDTFLLLDVAQDAAMGLDEVGTNLSFKAVTVGRSSGFPINLTPYTGASLKPYAPCHLEAVKESNGDWTLTWVRRTRVGGAWTSGTSIPLGELTEEYDVVLSNGVDDVTKTVTSPTYTWTQADQITDVGAEVMEGDLDWTVYQISDAVDRGFAAEATA